MNPNHSPSRERVERYSGSLRRYFRDNPFENRKVFYTFLAVCSATVMLGLWSLVPGIKSDRPYSHGPVASVHTSFDANCEACHKPQSVTSVGLSAFDPQSRWLDLSCQPCHGGPEHHKTEKWPSDWPAKEKVSTDGTANDHQCAICHHDHNGKDFSLVRLTDDHCTKCHENLANYHQAGSSVFSNKIVNFADGQNGGHPEFKKLTEPFDRRIKFSHAHHMSKGIGYVTDGRGQMTKADLAKLNPNDPKIVERYFPDAKSQPSDAVQLDCSSCHQLDSERTGAPRLDPNRPAAGETILAAGLEGAPTESILPPRGPGKYYLPVNFEAHCQACHPIASPQQTTVAGKSLPQFDLPHRKQPKEMKEVLRAKYSAFMLSPDGKPELLDKDAQDEDVLKLGKQIDEAVNKSLFTLFASVNPNAKNAISGGKCTECHIMDGNSAKVEELKVRSPNIPTVWFEHSRFNHISHKNVSCMDCHPNTATSAYPGGKAVFNAASIYSGNDQKINILGVDSCRSCHAPQNGGVASDGKTVGTGVRSNCTDCHSYHNGDNPFQGLGASARDPVPPPAPTLTP